MHFGCALSVPFGGACAESGLHEGQSNYRAFCSVRRAESHASGWTATVNTRRRYPGAAPGPGTGPGAGSVPSRAMSDLSVSGGYGVPSSGNGGLSRPAGAVPVREVGPRARRTARARHRAATATATVLVPGANAVTGDGPRPPSVPVERSNPFVPPEAVGALFGSGTIPHPSSLHRSTFDRRPYRRFRRVPTTGRAGACSSGTATVETSETEDGMQRGILLPEDVTPRPTGKVFHLSATSGHPTSSDTWVEDPRAGGSDW